MAALRIRNLPIGLVGFALVASLVLASDTSAAVVHGRLVALADHAPVAGARVNLLGRGFILGAASGGRGDFRFETASEGECALKVNATGFRSFARAIVVRPGENDLGDILVSTPADPLLDIGTRTRVRAESLVATIRLLDDSISVGEAPRFEVRIRNASADTVVLVRSVAGSDWFASPRVLILISGPADGFAIAPAEPIVTRGVGAEDFVSVAPGASFDPFAGSVPGARPDGTITTPGRYRAILRYVTTERESQPWVAGDCTDCTMDERLRRMLTRVSPVELTTAATFTVVPAAAASPTTSAGP